jgi:hypothetical protein
MLTAETMKRFLIFTVFIIVALLVGFFSYNKIDSYIRHRPVKDPDVLRNDIIASISNPFPQADTVVLKTHWMFCGNSDPDDLPIVFDTQLEESNNKSKLSDKLQLPVLTMIEFRTIMDTVRKYRFKGEYSSSLWDTCRIGKISADIKAEQLSAKKVRLYENYLYNDTIKFIQKDFAYDGDKWTFKITETSTEVRTK